MAKSDELTPERLREIVQHMNSGLTEDAGPSPGQLLSLADTLERQADRYEALRQAHQLSIRGNEILTGTVDLHAKRIAELEAMVGALHKPCVAEIASLREQIASLTQAADSHERHALACCADSDTLRSENERLKQSSYWCAKCKHPVNENTQFCPSCLLKESKVENERLKEEVRLQVSRRETEKRDGDFIISNLREQLAAEQATCAEWNKANAAISEKLEQAGDIAMRVAEGHVSNIQECTRVVRHSERQRAAAVVRANFGWTEDASRVVTAILDGQPQQHEHRPDSYGYCPGCTAPGEEGK